MQFWNTFAAKHPAAAKWVREGGLFVIVSNLITVFKYLLLQFLHISAFAISCASHSSSSSSSALRNTSMPRSSRSRGS